MLSLASSRALFPVKVRDSLISSSVSCNGRWGLSLPARHDHTTDTITSNQNISCPSTKKTVAMVRDCEIHPEKEISSTTLPKTVLESACSAKLCRNPFTLKFISGPEELEICVQFYCTGMISSIHHVLYPDEVTTRSSTMLANVRHSKRNQQKGVS